MFARIFAGAGGDFSGQQVHDQTVLVGRPHSAVAPQEACTCALFSAKTERTVEQPRREPLEAHRGFAQATAKPVHHAIDHATADQGFADRGIRCPALAMGEQVLNRNRQVVIRIHQSGSGRDDAVPVRIRVVGEGHLVPIFEADEPRHRVRAGAVHANLAVVVHGHERKRWIKLRIYDVNVQSIDRINRLPVRPSGAAEWIDAQLQISRANRLHIDDVVQILDIRQHEVLLVCRSSLEGRRGRHTLHTGIRGPQQLIGAVFDPTRNVCIRRPAVGRIVLETSILRWIVRRGDNNAIGQVFLATSVLNQNGMRNGGRRSNTVVALDYCFDIVGGQNFKRGALCWRRQRMCVLAHIEPAIDSPAATIVANGLSDGQDVRLGEGSVER